jgi:hypothetical protein
MLPDYHPANGLFPFFGLEMFRSVVIRYSIIVCAATAGSSRCRKGGCNTGQRFCCPLLPGQCFTPVLVQWCFVDRNHCFARFVCSACFNRFASQVP